MKYDRHQRQTVLHVRVAVVFLNSLCTATFSHTSKTNTNREVCIRKKQMQIQTDICKRTALLKDREADMKHILLPKINLVKAEKNFPTTSEVVRHNCLSTAEPKDNRIFVKQCLGISVSLENQQHGKNKQLSISQ